MTLPTQNPIPSSSITDQLFNAEKIDQVVNSDELQYSDRFGKKRFTFAGLYNTIQTWIGSLGSNSGASGIGLSQGGTVQNGINYLTPEMFGAKGDAIVTESSITGTDDTQAITDMFNTMLTLGLEGRLTDGKKYNITSPIVITVNEGATFKLSGKGTIVQNGNFTVLTIQNTVIGGILPVSNLQNVNYNLGDGSTTTNVTKITSPGHPFTAAGQIGKIFSDDVVPDSDSTGQYLGEFFVVGAVIDQDTFVTTGVLIEQYASNINVARPANQTIQFDDVNWRCYWRDDWTASMLTIRGCISPILNNVRADNTNGVFLNLTSCYRYEIGGIKGRNIKNRPDLTAYGYLVNDSSSFYGIVKNIDCINARHAFTTTSSKATAGDQRWDLRGRTIRTTVIDGFGQGCHQAFDTHSPCLEVEFINCRASQDFRGNTTGGCGIQIRGNGCRVINCTVDGSKIGIAFSTASKTSESSLYISNFKYEGPVNHIPVNISGNPDYRSDVWFDGVIKTDNINMFVVENSNLNINWLVGVMNPSETDWGVFKLNPGGVVRGSNINLRLTGVGTTGSLVYHQGTGSKAYFNDFSIEGVGGRLSYFGRSSSQYAIESYFSDGVLDASLPGVPFLGYPTTTPLIGAKYKVGAVTKPLGNRTVSYSAAGNVTINLQFSSDPIVPFKLSASVAGVVISSISQGSEPGQMLVLYLLDTSANTILVKGTGTGINIGSDYTLSSGKAISLWWDGSVWRPANSF